MEHLSTRDFVHWVFCLMGVLSTRVLLVELLSTGVFGFVHWWICPLRFCPLEFLTTGGFFHKEFCPLRILSVGVLSTGEFACEVSSVGV